MTYTPTIWQTGDIITAIKLNHMENGISNAGSGYDIILHEIVPSNNDPTLTGTGISLADAIQKVQNGENVSLLFINEVTAENRNGVFSSNSAIVDENYIYFGLNYDGALRNIKMSTNSELYTKLPDGSMYSLAYNDGTYTFTFEMWDD